MIRSELLTSFRAAGAPSPPSAEWTDWMGRLLAAARAQAGDGDPGGAADLLHGLRAELELPPEPELLIVEARMRLRSGRPGAARSVLTALLDSSPDHTTALRLRARVLASQGDLRGAVSDAIRVLAATPDQDLLHSTLVRMQLMGEWEAAHNLAEEHRATLPEVDAALSQARAELDADASDAEVLALFLKPPHRRLADDAPAAAIEAALPLLQQDVDDEPASPRAWERLGAAQGALGHHTDAVSSFDRVTDLEPLAEEAWFGLAAATADAGDWPAAMAAADRALALNPDSHRARMIRVRAASELGGGAWSVTEADDRRRLLLETKDPQITEALAVALDASGDHRDASAMRAMAGSPTAARPVDAPVGAVDGLVVYTVITGGYEQPSDPRDVLGDDADVVILTDDPGALPETMRPIAQTLELDAPPQLASRHPKMMPHLYFPDHERSIYIDANFHLRSDPRFLARGLSEETPMTVLEHSERRTPVAEARLVVERGFATWEQVRVHFDQQRVHGFDPANAPLSYGGFLVRQHRDPVLIDAMAQWWDQFEGGVRRDQLSLDFALWRAGVSPIRLTMNNHRNEHWIRIPHV